MILAKKQKIELKSKVERIKDLIRTIIRIGLTGNQTTNAIKDIGALLVKEGFKEEEILELRNWIDQLDGGK